jgi:hypothetical protein
MPTLPLPDLSRRRRYQHRRPQRPSHLPRRLEPPPERPGPPDLSWFLYAGIGLAVLLVLLAIPYIIGYFVELLSV